MSYKIRYGPAAFPGPVGNGGMLFRWKLCAAGAVLIWAAGHIYPQTVEILREWFCREPVTAGEMAVMAFARALRQGKGWYDGLAVWCAAILFGQK